MKKKILSICLVVALIATAVVGGTLAYFSDTESNKNVMTVGKVDIVQKEDFTPAEDLLIPKDYDLGKADYNKVVTVKNEGSLDVWTRTIVAIEHTAGDGNGANGIAWKMNTIKGDANYDGKVFYGDLDYLKVGDKYYSVQLFTYKNTLAVGASVDPVKGFFLSESATEADLEGLTKDAEGNYTYDVLVLSQAVQADMNDATTAEAALNEAFGEVSDANAAQVAEWLAAVQ